MWLKRLTNSFLGIRNKEELENDLKILESIFDISLDLFKDLIPSKTNHHKNIKNNINFITKIIN